MRRGEGRLEGVHARRDGVTLAADGGEVVLDQGKEAFLLAAVEPDDGAQVGHLLREKS